MKEKYGDLQQYAHRNRLQELIEPDLSAAKFFAEFLFDDETHIKPERQVEYNANASVLNAIGQYLSELTGKNNKLGFNRSNLWAIISESVQALDATTYQHSLPANPVRLKEKFRNYSDHGYFHLIHKGNKNINAKKMNDVVERLILSIYCMENLPFGAWVHDNYLQFIAGTRSIVDKDTGILYDRSDFFDANRGSYITLSRSTVYNIINNPDNKVIIDRMRNNRIDHITKGTPYNHRRLPQYSLSKISMDDRTLSRKTSDGKWLNAYMAFDVLSDAIIGCVHSTDSPSVNMIWECFREMYQVINEQNLMWPGEIEVENHLMRDIEEDLRKMFPYVTFCAPGISRSKRAEHKIRAKKYGDEKMNQVGIGRWSGKGPYKTKSENKDEDYKQPRIPLDQLIADDKESIHRFNHSLHPNQKMFPGKTRWQVLTENVNPDLGRPQKHHLFRYMGLRTRTSIRNNDFVQVMYEKYAIDNQASIGRLKPNNYEVEAFYIPSPEGSIGEVYLYQGDTFITRASKIERYNEAKIERTEEDERIRTDQAKRQAHFFKREKDLLEEKITRKLEFLPGEIISGEILAEIEPVPVDIPDAEEQEEDYMELAKNWSPEVMRRRAINEL